MCDPRVLVAPGSRKLSCRGPDEDPEILRASTEMLTINNRLMSPSRSRENYPSVFIYISPFYHLKRCIEFTITCLLKD